MHNIQLILLVSVIFFTSLAYGGVLTWTKGILELTALLIGSTTIIIFAARNKKWPIKLSPLNITIFCFAGLIFLQLIPLPNIFLRYFSATTVTLQENHNFATISLYNFATLENLLLLISYLVIYFFTLCCAYNLKTQRQISWSIYLLGCTVAIFGLIQYLIPLQIIGFYAKQWTFNGVCGTFISQTNFAALMELTIPLGLGLFITRPKQTSVKINLKQLYCFSGIVIMVLALFLTTSRIGIISFFFSLLLMCTVAKLNGDKSKWFVIAIIFFALALLFWIGVDPVSRRFSLEAIRHEFIQGDRIQIWQATLNMVKSFPVFGVGWGNYGYVFPIYTPP
ncbi:MAG: O-antigen ligase family protein, partial [Planctomycetes bacterium]|nr:O-antigen ligase family protein [Planctomycetota bacterium]